jgi:hypothetical protein
MKTVLLFVASILVSINASALITLIDVQEKSGEVVTVQSADEYSFNQLSGKLMGYRGKADEAIALFEQMAQKELPKGLTDYDFEVNPATGTISVTISQQGVVGLDYTYFVIKRLSI